MQTRWNLIALSVISLAAFAAVPVRADVSFTTSRFQITFPNGWQSLTPPKGADSILIVLKQASSAGGGVRVTTDAHPLTAEEYDAGRQLVYGLSTSDAVSKGSKTLGGKAFTYAEYTDGNGLGRFYFMSSGTQYVVASVSYAPSEGTAAVTEMESALATLTLPGTPIHPLAVRSSATLRPVDHDLLGRSRTLSAPTWLFRLPTR
jgi:hypothetical protein